MSAESATPASDFFTQLQPGQKLAGCYLLQRRVESPGPVVWLAHDEVLGKDISLHFLPAEVRAQSSVLEKLRGEVKRARQIIHPRILRTYDLIEEDEWSAIAMDPFASRPLAAVMAEHAGGSFEVGEIWPLLRELCEILEEAHRVKLAHGALSPDDVLVGDGQAKVLNFGGGPVLAGAAPEAPQAAFLSPQVLGGAKPVAADDLFSLGALAHTLLVGEPPFSGRDRSSVLSVGEHLSKLGRPAKNIPAAWEQAIAQSLSADPAARPASCGDLAKLLDPGAQPAAAPVAPVVPAEPAPVTPEAVEAKAETPAVPVESTEAKAEVPAEPAPVIETKAPEIAEAPKSAEPAAPEPEAAKEEPVPAPVPGETPAVEKEPAVSAPVESVAPAAAAAATEATAPAVEPAKPSEPAVESKTSTRRTERRVKGTADLGTPSSPSESKVDAGKLAEKVRREEAARPPRYDDDEGFDDRPHGSGPSLLSILSIVVVLGVVGFILYRVFVPASGSSTSGVSTSSESVVETSTPAPLAGNAATPAPESTPVPMTPKPEATPEPKMVTATTPEKAPEAATPASAPATPAPAVAETPEQIQAALAELKQNIARTTGELPVARKAAEELTTQQQKLDDELKKAEMAAQEAEKAAAEKKQQAEDARKAAQAAAEKLAAHKSEIAKAEDRLTSLHSDAQSKESALAEAKKKAAAKPKETTTASTKATSTPAPAPVAATPAPAPAPTSAPEDARTAFEQKMKELSRVLGTTPTPAPAPALPKAPEATPAPAMELAKATTPAPTVTPPEAIPKPPAASSEAGLTNSLGMRLLPLPDTDILMAIWPTRVRDFEVFAKTAGLKSSLWKDPGFKQGPDHPVVNVTWQEAAAFCKWLTAKEQKEGMISDKQSYRLPSDLEWSAAAGLAHETGSTPEARDMSVPDVYPWGNAWPPPVGAGNYTGEETGSDVAIKGYNDGFAWTSPVGSFPPNKLGFYDLGGNVWQWCMDSWNAESKAKVLRGASWYNGALKLSLLTSCRVHASPDSSTDNYGFRVVLTGAPGTAKTRK